MGGTAPHLDSTADPERTLCGPTPAWASRTWFELAGARRAVARHETQAANRLFLGLVGAGRDQAAARCLDSRSRRGVRDAQSARPARAAARPPGAGGTLSDLRRDGQVPVVERTLVDEVGPDVDWPIRRMLSRTDAPVRAASVPPGCRKL